MPCYFQLKITQNIPSVVTLNEQVGRKDKPLCILWNAQEKQLENQRSVGEYAIIPKDFLYELLKLTLKDTQK